MTVRVNSYSATFKLTAIFNMAIHLLMSISLTFIPYPAYSSETFKLIPADKIDTKYKTKSYILLKGESIKTILEKNRITLAELKNINQEKTFPDGIENIKEGDEINIPAVSFVPVIWDEIGDKNSESENLHKVASVAKNIGESFSNARAIATSTVSRQIQQWLSNFGTARVKIETDENFSLKNSQIDLLMPLFEQKNSFLFSQGSLHHTDERFLSNLGIGYRWYNNNWMLGSNSFLDYDLSRNHTRLGVGVEYWRDFLKLGANGYLRLTNWKSSPDQDDYEERPTNGWDIRSQVWLPTLPQLGGELRYEQYYGNEVGLFGKNNRQHDPYAITAGINYTPFPLLTFNTEYSEGASGVKDARIGVQMNYQPNIPWQQQINPDAVSAKRTLTGNRYDFVERNNNIILEYRRKEVISLKTTKLVTGYAGEKKSLGVSINSKYDIERIDWSASSLIAAGGKIISDGNSDYSVELPAYQSGQQGINTYTITAVAVDKKGNVSNKSETQISVTQAAINANMSTLTPDNVILPADGKSQQQLVLRINDHEGNPVDISEKEITVQKETKQRGKTGAIFTPFSRQATGEYVSILTAGTESEIFTITPFARNTRLASANVTFTKEYRSSLSVTPTTITAGVENATVRVIVRNANGDLQDDMENHIKLKFSPDLSITTSTFVKIAEGVYEAQISGKKAGKTTITALVNGASVMEQTHLTLKADVSSATIKGKISAEPTFAVVDEQVTYTALLVDKNNNPLGEGVPVAWSSNNGSILGDIVTNTDASGSTRVTVTRSQAGTAKVSLILPSGTINAPDVLFSEGRPDESRSELNLTPTTIMAGKEFAILELVLKDQNGNPLSGQMVKGNSDNTSVTIGDAQEDNSKPGHYIMAVTGNKSGLANLSVMVNNKTLNKTRNLTVKGDVDSWNIVQVTPTKNSFTAGDANGVTYSATVTDALGNKLPGVVVSWQLKGQAESFDPVSRTNNDGIATTTVKSNTSGELIMTAYLDDNNKKQASKVVVIPGILDVSKSSFIADKKSIGADGKETVTLTVILKDIYDNGITNKAINIDGYNALSGFTLSPVTDNGDGSYQIKAMSTNKGQVTLLAKVDGQTIGSGITITVGATTPDIRFANAQQRVSYTKNFTQSQIANGIPGEVQQMWSSSSPEVASVNSSTGRVTLHKSGVATVTVQTSGNGQFNPAQASYELVVDKAEPGLKSTQSIIQTKWNDKTENKIEVAFDNQDVGGELSLEYIVDNPSVATISDNGVLSKVKPGSTNIIATTKENERFKSASIKVPYIINKGVHLIVFNKTTEETNDKASYIVQSPNENVPSELQIRWESSNPNAVNLTESGTISSLGEGQSRLTLNVLPNEYYEQSSGYYDVEVYTKPVIGIHDVQYTNQGERNSSGEWKPFYTSDSMMFNWRTKDKYKNPHKVAVKLKDKNTGQTLYDKEYSSISEFEDRNESIPANKSFWDKTITLEIIYYGRAGSDNSIYSKDISVKALTPPELKGLEFSVMSYIAWNGDNSPAGMCRKNLFEGLRHVIIAPRAKFNFGSNTLLEPMSLILRQKAINGHGAASKDILQGAVSGSVDFYSNDFGATSVNSMGNDCWENHWGNHSVEVQLSYRGKMYTYKDESTMYWDGFGTNMSGANNFRKLSGQWE
ncbi:inverse autotransporter beta domain-containing protein [Escherichia coli]|uniref:inverse autotransporter beta domain-containing protein n=1 Tax=Escherichia coli TaxID=562 RepID=UPI0039C31752